MLIVIPPTPATIPAAPHDAQSEPSLRRSERPGATVMEYVVMISLILVVLIIAIQNIGSRTNSSLSKAANATGGISGAESPGSGNTDDRKKPGRGSGRGGSDDDGRGSGRGNSDRDDRGNGKGNGKGRSR